MAFMLYRLDPSRRMLGYYAELVDHVSLWGTNGAVARCAEGSIRRGGKWRVTEADLLADLVPRVAHLEPAAAAEFAVLDDLVPKGPEITIGRILEVRGYLQNDYNPILITMQQVLNLDEDQARSGNAEDLKKSIPVPPASAPVIRTINYLWKGWRPPRSFGGALLWPEHWQYLTASCERSNLGIQPPAFGRG